MSRVTGLHHVTVIAGDPQRNLDFYTGTLGMRLVKLSVNQDAPDTYHLFYADAEGHAGTDLTFFPWPTMPAGRRGVGLTNEVGLAVPAGSLDWWAERLRGAGVAVGGPTRRYGERALVFDDPHGLGLALVETSDGREFTPWADGPVPAERQVRGLHGVRMAERDLEATARFLVDGLGMERVGEEDGWHRFATGAPGSGRVVEVQELPHAPGDVVHAARAPRRLARARRRDGARGTRARAAGRRAPDAGDRPLLVQVGLLQGAGRRALRDRDGRPRLRGGRVARVARRAAHPAAVARAAARGDRARPAAAATHRRRRARGVSGPPDARYWY